MTRRRLVAAGCGLAAGLLLATVPVTRAQSIQPGAWELGLGLAVASGSAGTRVDAAGRVGTFAEGLGRSLVSPELSLLYRHQASLDQLGVEGGLYTVYPIGSGAVSGHLGLVGGWTRTWVGSFAQSTYPVGASLGARVLRSETAGLRIDYRVRRILGDAVADTWEESWIAGISVFWDND